MTHSVTPCQIQYTSKCAINILCHVTYHVLETHSQMIRNLGYDMSGNMKSSIKYPLYLIIMPHLFISLSFLHLNLTECKLATILFVPSLYVLNTCCSHMQQTLIHLNINFYYVHQWYKASEPLHFFFKFIFIFILTHRLNVRVITIRSTYINSYKLDTDSTSKTLCTYKI